MDILKIRDKLTGAWKSIPAIIGPKGDKGDPGQDGISPTLSENKVGKITTVTVTDGNGTHTFEVNDGADGKDGTGAGDMLMATYDSDGNGIVDDSEKLGGVAANKYALKTDIPEIPTYTMSATDDGNGNVSISIGG